MKKFSYLVQIRNRNEVTEEYMIRVKAEDETQAQAKAAEWVSDDATQYADKGDEMLLMTPQGDRLFRADLEAARESITVYMVVCHHASASLSHSSLFINGSLSHEHYDTSMLSGKYLVVLHLMRNPGESWELLRSYSR
jgi:hypothetical protein